MDNPLLTSGLAASLLLASCAASAPVAARRPLPPPVPYQTPQGPVTYQVFYDELSPYGQWVNDPEYGYTWVPNVEPGFQPYRSRGHWAYTDYGWTWVSDYPWGWAPFHYGRWRWSDFSGWVWVPGYTWGPAWVAWRQSAGYYGWAPLGPPLPRGGGVQVSIGMSFSFGDAPAAPALWCFVPAARVASVNLGSYYVPPTQTTVVYNNTTVIHNTYVNNSTVNNTTVNNTTVNDGHREAFPAGPAREDVERASGQPVQSLRLASRATPGGAAVQGNTLAVYRPPVASPGKAALLGGGAAPAPRRVVPLEAVRANPASRPAEMPAAAPASFNRPEPAPRRELPAAETSPTAASVPADPGQRRPDRASRLNPDATPAPADNFGSPRPEAAPRPRRNQPDFDLVAPANPPAPRPDRRDGMADFGGARPAAAPGFNPPPRAESRPPRPERAAVAPRPPKPPRPPREEGGRRR